MAYITPTHPGVAIIGGGITGLTVAHKLKAAGIPFTLFEKSDRLGGQIQTWSQSGYVFESGPNTGALSNPEVAELFDELRGDCQLEIADPAAKRRLIWKSGRFHPLPSSLFTACTTPLFTWTDKFRILGEPFRTKGGDPLESVAELTVRRLGRSFLDYAVDPFISGIYAGDPYRLVTQYALPKLYRLEQGYGSFVRGALAKARLPKSARDKKATKEVFSAQGGLSQLIAALEKRLAGSDMHFRVRDLTVSPIRDAWQLTYVDAVGERRQQLFEAVVTTVHAYALPTLLPFVPDRLMAPVRSLVYAPVVQVAVGVPVSNPAPYMAFGGLVPSVERESILGVLFPSACFAGRAPRGRFLCSFFVGGVRHPEVLTLSDEALRARMVDALHRMLGIEDGVAPEVFQIFRHRHAIPQYDRTCEARQAALRAIDRHYPGLYVGGNVREGVGMADRIRQGARIARQIVEARQAAV